eukprot:5250205-Prymnesium_polylepis.1
MASTVLANTFEHSGQRDLVGAYRCLRHTTALCAGTAPAGTERGEPLLSVECRSCIVPLQ